MFLEVRCKIRSVFVVSHAGCERSDGAVGSSLDGCRKDCGCTEGWATLHHEGRNAPRLADDPRRGISRPSPRHQRVYVLAGVPGVATRRTGLLRSYLYAMDERKLS